MSQLIIIVNGQETHVATSSVLSDLVSSLGLKPERVAIELNRRIVRRKDWQSTMLSEGDRVEIVHFVGGGSQLDNFCRSCQSRGCAMICR